MTEWVLNRSHGSSRRRIDDVSRRQLRRSGGIDQGRGAGDLLIRLLRSSRNTLAMTSRFGHPCATPRRRSLCNPNQQIPGREVVPAIRAWTACSKIAGRGHGPATGPRLTFRILLIVRVGTAGLTGATAPARWRRCRSRPGENERHRTSGRSKAGAGAIHSAGATTSQDPAIAIRREGEDRLRPRLNPGPAPRSPVRRPDRGLAAGRCMSPSAACDTTTPSMSAVN